jgi:hypothetical protein
VKKLPNKPLALALAAAVGAAPLMPLATSAAYADGYRGRGFAPHHRYEPRPDWRNGPGRHYGYVKKKDRTGEKIAIGIGAVMLGLILGAAAHDRRH